MKNLLPLLTFACLVSCQTNGDDVPDDNSRAAAPEPATPSPAAPSPNTDIDVKNLESMIGQPLMKAQEACDAAEVPHRVVELDGEALPVTMDYRPERLNFKVKDGLITAVTTG